MTDCSSNSTVYGMWPCPGPLLHSCDGRDITNGRIRIEDVGTKQSWVHFEDNLSTVQDMEFSSYYYVSEGDTRPHLSLLQTPYYGARPIHFHLFQVTPRWNWNWTNQCLLSLHEMFECTALKGHLTLSYISPPEHDAFCSQYVMWTSIRKDLSKPFVVGHYWGKYQLRWLKVMLVCIRVAPSFLSVGLGLTSMWGWVPMTSI